MGKVFLLYESEYAFVERLAWRMDGHSKCTHISLVFGVSSLLFEGSSHPLCSLGLAEMVSHALTGWRKYKEGMRLMQKLERRSFLLRDLGCLNAAMPLLAAAVIEAEGQCVWVVDSAVVPRLCVQDED